MKNPFHITTSLFISLFILGLMNISFAQNGFQPTIKPQIWGQVHGLNIGSEDGESTIVLRRIRLGAKGNVYNNVGYAFLFEAASNPKLLQAWLDYNFLKLANFRVGQFKYPFGIENYISATVVKFINPSGITDRITKNLGRQGSSYRDMGIQVGGKIGLAKEIEFGYKLMVMNGNGINTRDNNGEKDMAFRFNCIVPHGIDFGVSYFNGTYQENDENGYGESAYGAHFIMKNELLGRKLFLQGEYIAANYKTVNSQIEPWGYYLYGTYFIDKNIEVGLRYDYYEPDKAAETIIEQSRTTLSIGYYFEERQRINLNYELREDSGNPDLKNLLTIQFQYAIQ
ncbi:MAG: hypothetical protein JW995_15435 [Melioribacteraceae bacterium]|nr:hypothetical protein [Melioribacteraceae bacterium]